MAEGRLVALLHYAILACLVFGMDECCVVLCDWLTVLHSHVQPRFYSHLMIGKRGRWLLASDSFCFVLWMCRTFSHPPSRWLICYLRPCGRCFGPEWIPFPFTDLIQIFSGRFGPNAPFRPFLPEGINSKAGVSVHTDFQKPVSTENKLVSAEN